MQINLLAPILLTQALIKQILKSTEAVAKKIVKKVLSQN